MVLATPTDRSCRQEKHWQFGIGRKAGGSELRWITRCVTVGQALVSREVTGYSDCLVDSHPRNGWKHGKWKPNPVGKPVEGGFGR